MKFMKGAMLGGIVATGIYMMYSGNEQNMRKKMMKKSKHFMKKVGIL